MASAAAAGHEELGAVNDDRHSEFNLAEQIAPPPQAGAFHVDAEQYKALYARSISDPDGFWAEQARSTLTWFRDFKEVRGGSFADGDVRWFAEGQLNVCYNCVDRA
jgi:acetyl-CoA synthetase